MCWRPPFWRRPRKVRWRAEGRHRAACVRRNDSLLSAKSALRDVQVMPLLMRLDRRRVARRDQKKKSQGEANARRPGSCRSFLQALRREAPDLAGADGGRIAAIPVDRDDE